MDLLLFLEKVLDVFGQIWTMVPEVFQHAFVLLESLEVGSEFFFSLMGKGGSLIGFNLPESILYVP